MDIDASELLTYTPSSFTESTELLDNLGALQQRAMENGHLFF